MGERHTVENPQASSLEQVARAYIQSHPGIEREFDAATELVKLRKLPSAERASALKTYKEKLFIQQEAWMTCHRIIETALEKNPDTAREDLRSVIFIFEDYFGFSGKDVDTADHMVSHYHRARANALAAREDFPDDKELVEYVTGIPMKDSTLSISMGPMNIDITADTFTAQKLYKDSEGEEGEFPYAGFATHRGGDAKPIHYSVIKAGAGRQQQTSVHEFQHQKHALFRRHFERYIPKRKTDVLIEGYRTETDPEQKKQILSLIFETNILYAWDRAKDEILAFGSDGSTPERIASVLLLKNEEPYDYLQDLRNANPGDALWQEYVQKTLIDKYDRVIREGIESFDRLQTLYSKEEAIARLSPHPLEKWSAVTAHMFEHRSGRESFNRTELRQTIEALKQKVEDAKKREAQEQKEARHKKEVQERLTRRAFLGGAVLGTAALAANEVRKAGVERPIIHERMRNVETMETQHAHYRIVYSTDLIQTNPETIEGSDAVVLQESGISTEEGAFTAVEEHRLDRHWKSRTNFEALLANVYDLPGERVPAQYEQLVERATQKQVPLYFLDTVRNASDGILPSGMIQGAGAAAEAMLAGAVASSVIKNIGKPVTRRDALFGAAKVAIGTYLVAPLAKSVHTIPRVLRGEPNEASSLRIGEKQLDRFNDSAHPELRTRDGYTRNLLIAQKTETLGRWLQEKLKRKPVITLVVDPARSGIEGMLIRPERKRVAELKKRLGKDFAKEGKIIKVTPKRWNSTARSFTDDAFE